MVPNLRSGPAESTDGMGRSRAPAHTRRTSWPQGSLRSCSSTFLPSTSSRKSNGQRSFSEMNCSADWRTFITRIRVAIVREPRHPPKRVRRISRPNHIAPTVHAKPAASARTRTIRSQRGRLMGGRPCNDLATGRRPGSRRRRRQRRQRGAVLRGATANSARAVSLSSAAAMSKTDPTQGYRTEEAAG